MRVAVFLSHLPLYFSIYVIDFVNSLANRGIHVDFFLQSAGDRVPRFSAPVSVIQLPDVCDLNSFPDSGKVRSVLRYIPERNQAVIREMAHREAYDHCIGIESTGLFLARLAADVSGCPYSLYNLEIYNRENPGVWGGEIERIKVLERELISEIDLFLIPDEERLSAYEESIGGQVPSEKVLYFPISLSPTFPGLSKSFWRETIGVPDDVQMALYLGQLSPNRFNEEMVSGFQQVKSRSIFAVKGICHGDFTYIEKLRSLDPLSRVVFDVEETPWNERYSRIVGADVGLVYYRGHVINDRLTGRSSDKVAAYLQAGMPIVCPNYSSFQSLLDEYGCGVGIGDLRELPAAIDEILSNLERYRPGVTRAYEEVYNLDVHLSNLLKRLRPQREAIRRD